MSRSVNMAVIIGNLTRDPEMRYTPQGNAVTSFGVATNRTWVSNGEGKEEVEFHNIVAWNKLAELCNQLLAKGRRVYIKGRLQTRTWEGPDGVRRSKTEIVADDMLILDNKYKQRESGDMGSGIKSQVMGQNPVSDISDDTTQPVTVDKPAVDASSDSKTDVSEKEDTPESTKQSARGEATSAETSPEQQVTGEDEIKVEDIPF